MTAKQKAAKSKLYANWNALLKHVRAALRLAEETSELYDDPAVGAAYIVPTWPIGKNVGDGVPAPVRDAIETMRQEQEELQGAAWSLNLLEGVLSCVGPAEMNPQIAVLIEERNRAEKRAEKVA